jgi:hypothetical protein
MRVVRSTPPAIQMNLEDRRPFCNTVLRQYPIGHHGVTAANHLTTLPGSPTKNPEGFGRSQRIDQYGLRPIRSTPPALQTNPDDSRPLRKTVLQRNPIGHHRAKWRTTARLCLGAQLKNPKIRPDPKGPTRWAATDLDEISSSVRVQAYLSRRRAASIEQHDPHSRRLTFS